MQGRGYKTKTLIDFESVFGVSPSPSKAIQVPFNTNSMKHSRNTSDPSTITGSRNPVEPIEGNQTNTGDLINPADARGIGYMLKAMFGVPVTTAAEPTGMYKHVFKISDTQPSLTVVAVHPDLTEHDIFTGCKVSSMNLSAGGDGELTTTFSLVGSRCTISDTAYNASPTVSKLKRFSNFQASIKQDDAVLAKTIKTCDMTIDMGLDTEQYTMGDGGVLGDIPEGLVKISGTLNALHTSANNLVKMAAKNEVHSLELSLTNGDFSLCFKLPEIKYAPTTASIDGPGGSIVDLSYNAFLDAAEEGSAIVVELVNDVASYA